MQKVTFEDTDVGRRHYEMAFQAIAMTQKQTPISDWDDVIDLIRKLKSVGTPAKQKVGSKELYDLQEGGGEILLEKGEMKCLLDYIGQPIWLPLALEDAQELKKWLEAIPKEKGSLRHDAKPDAKRAVAGSIRPKASEPEEPEEPSGNETIGTPGNTA